MRAGRLRHRITIEAPTGTTDAFGQVAESWATVATVWAEIKAGMTREVFADGSGNTDQTMYTVTTRYSSAAIDDTMRVRHGTQVFRILAATDPDGTRTIRTLTCREQDK